MFREVESATSFEVLGFEVMLGAVLVDVLETLGPRPWNFSLATDLDLSLDSVSSCWVGFSAPLIRALRIGLIVMSKEFLFYEKDAFLQLGLLHEQRGGAQFEVSVSWVLYEGAGVNLLLIDEGLYVGVLLESESFTYGKKVGLCLFARSESGTVSGSIAGCISYKDKIPHQECSNLTAKEYLCKNEYQLFDESPVCITENRVTSVGYCSGCLIGNNSQLTDAILVRITKLEVLHFRGFNIDSSDFSSGNCNCGLLFMFEHNITLLDVAKADKACGHTTELWSVSLEYSLLVCTIVVGKRVGAFKSGSLLFGTAFFEIAFHCLLNDPIVKPSMGRAFQFRWVIAAATNGAFSSCLKTYMIIHVVVAGHSGRIDAALGADKMGFGDASWIHVLQGKDEFNNNVRIDVVDKGMLSAADHCEGYNCNKDLDTPILVESVEKRGAPVLGSVQYDLVKTKELRAGHLGNQASWNKISATVFGGCWNVSYGVEGCGGDPLMGVISKDLTAALCIRGELGHAIVNPAEQNLMILFNGGLLANGNIGNESNVCTRVATYINTLNGDYVCSVWNNLAADYLLLGMNNKRCVLKTSSVFGHQVVDYRYWCVLHMCDGSCYAGVTRGSQGLCWLKKIKRASPRVLKGFRDIEKGYVGLKDIGCFLIAFGTLKRGNLDYEIGLSDLLTAHTYGLKFHKMLFGMEKFCIVDVMAAMLCLLYLDFGCGYCCLIVAILGGPCVCSFLELCYKSKSDNGFGGPFFDPWLGPSGTGWWDAPPLSGHKI